MINGWNRKMNIKSLMELVKFFLSLFIALSAVFGFVLANNLFSLKAFFLGVFVLLLAWGCAALNNIQDKTYDACFLRTCKRVLPSQKLKTRTAFIIAVLGIVFGLLGLLLFFKGFLAFVYGILALIFYNFLYTPLKKRTLLAIIPGAISGMLPPLIGWSAAGAQVLDLRIIIIMVIFGQVMMG